MFAGLFADKMVEVLTAAGDYVENRIGQQIENSDWKAPDLEGDPEEKVWYKVTLTEGIAGDGSPAHIYLKKGTGSRLCIFLSGGGIAWDDYSAARPVTGGAVAAGQSNFYWNNLRPFTQIMNINVGITETGKSWNPFDSWSFIVVAYATGDAHVGDRDFTYKLEDGQEDVVHFHGHRNFLEAMDIARRYFPDPKRLLIAGDSAGAFAVPALAPEIMEEYYPTCNDVTLLSDSALLLFDDWKTTVRDFWGADARFWEPISGNNLFLDWYRALMKNYQNRIRFLFACSVHDYLLSTFYSAVNYRKYETSQELQDLFRAQLKDQVEEMKRINPDTGVFLNRFHISLEGIGSGGTVHTAVRKPHFHVLNDEKATMARWLYDGVRGKVYDVGMEYLE